ncbi:MAG: hypothetical protein ACTTKN_07610 [Phocaeicola sp.]|uniref:hypothetical protein n=1 Tax=Phocaeicola sp. TaxID=2773926 RepID=UPI003F9F7E03
MRLRLVTKYGAVVCVLLFCLAMGVYAYMSLNDAEHSRELNLFELVPSDCNSFLASDNVNTIISEFDEISFQKELRSFQSNSLMDFFIQTLINESSEHLHNISNVINGVVVCYYDTLEAADDVVLFRTVREGKNMLADILRSDFLAGNEREEKYRHEDIVIYPLKSHGFLSTYSGNGGFVMSYEKYLIEKVIDAYLDKKSVMNDPVFRQTPTVKTLHNYVRLYTRCPFTPVPNELTGWSLFEVKVNSDVIYLTGESYWKDSRKALDEAHSYFRSVPDVLEDRLVMSADHDSISTYMSQVPQCFADHLLFGQCVKSLSPDASYILVADGNIIADDTLRFTPYFSRYMLRNMEHFRPFILSSQISESEGRLSNLIVLTYKK